MVTFAAAAFVLACTGCHSGGSSAQLAQLQQDNARLREQVAQLRTQLGLPPASRDLASVSGSQIQPTITDAGELIETRRIIFDTKFDAEANITALTSRRQILAIKSGSRKKHLVTLTYEYHGSNPAKPAGPVRMDIDIRFHGPHYQNVKVFLFHIDNGVTVTCPVANYKAVRRTSGGRTKTRHDDEFVTVSIPADSLSKVAKTQHLAGTLGRTKVQFSTQQLAMFKALDKKRRTPKPDDDPKP